MQRDDLQPSISPNNDQNRQRIEFYMEKEAIFTSKTHELGCPHLNINRDIYDSSSKTVSSCLDEFKTVGKCLILLVLRKMIIT